MKAHVIGGGFGGLAAAAFLIRNAGVSGPDITIYEANERMGGGLSLSGSAQTGYSLPGSVFDSEFRCTFDLLRSIPTLRDPATSVTDAFFAFNTNEPFNDRVHIIDRSGQVVHDPRFGLTLHDGLDLAKLSLTPELLLGGQRIEECFSPRFFSTEFWLLWSTIMGSLPQHSATEFRRYINRFVGVFPNLSDMKRVLRTPFNQYQFFIEPLVAWLHSHEVNFRTGCFVSDLGFAPGRDRITVDRIDLERNGEAQQVAVAPADIVLATLGSQAEDASVGSMTEPPPPQSAGRSSSLWKRLAAERAGFGRPEAFFGAAQVPLSRWVTFTVTTTGTEFVDQLSALTKSQPGIGGLLTLKDSSWVLSVTIFHQPEVIGQPPGTKVWWGYGLHPERPGDFVKKRMDACTGAELLEEVVRQLGFDAQFDAIMASSISIPCNMPFVNNIWLPRSRGDRPDVVPRGATNLGLIGQYVEQSRDIAFTVEYSARSAWEAIYRLLQRGPAPPAVYQGQVDPKALLSALKVFLGNGL